MEIKKVMDAGKLTLVLNGRLDTVTSPKLDAEVKSIGSKVKELVFDMTDLEYISSAGLRVLLSAQKLMNKQGEMKITHANSTIMDIFEVTGFDGILTIE